jgi:hypothetical protein
MIEIRMNRQDLHDESRTARLPLGDLDAKIVTILEKSRFESAHWISERSVIARKTVLQYLRDFIGFK